MRSAGADGIILLAPSAVMTLLPPLPPLPLLRLFRPRVHNPTSTDPQALLEAQSEHLFRGLFPHRNQKSVRGEAQPGELRAQTLHSRQARRRGDDLESAPLNNRIGRKHDGLPDLAERNVAAMAEQKAKIAADHHSGASAAGVVNPQPIGAVTQPGAQLPWPAGTGEQLSEWSVR